MKETITLSQRELQRIQVLEQVLRKRITLKAAAGMMRVCYRQAKRLWTRYRNGGAKSLAHGHRGRRAPNARGAEVRQRVLVLHREVYSQFNDTHFVEMLAEREDLRIGRETVRRWLREAGIRPKRRRRPPQHRSRRPRRPQLGLLLQWDGSPHHWFGPQKPAVSLLHATDDATGTVLGALFRSHEDAVGYLKLLDMVLRRQGIPAAVYQDRHSALFRSDAHWSHEEELAGIRFPTHVGRALQELGIETIPAYSPQGKGRIERQGGTFQDRLIAEMALAGITEIEPANAWLEDYYIDRFNTRFAKPPAQAGSAFRRITAARRYEFVSFAYQATVANDNTVRLGGLIIDLPPGPGHRSFARSRVLVRQHLDGAWSVWFEGKRIGGHGPTPLREPFRGWRPRSLEADRRAKHILQIYYETTPAPSPGGHFCLAVEGTS